MGTHTWQRFPGEVPEVALRKHRPSPSSPKTGCVGGVEANVDKGPALRLARGVSDVNLARALQFAEGDPWAVVVEAGGPAWPGVSAPYKDFKLPQPGQCNRDQEVVPRPSPPRE